MKDEAWEKESLWAGNTPCITQKHLRHVCMRCQRTWQRTSDALERGVMLCYHVMFSAFYTVPVIKSSAMQPLDTKFNAFVDLQELGVGKIFLDIYLSIYLNASVSAAAVIWAWPCSLGTAHTVCGIDVYGTDVCLCLLNDSLLLRPSSKISKQKH